MLMVPLLAPLSMRYDAGRRVAIALPLFVAGVAGQGRPALFGNLSSLREAL